MVQFRANSVAPILRTSGGSLRFIDGVATVSDPGMIAMLRKHAGRYDLTEIVEPPSVRELLSVE